MTTPSGQAIGLSYDNGRISGVTVNGATLVTAAGYEPFGAVSVWQWGNGHKTYRDHDADGRLTTWEYRNGASILRRDLTWDNANRITAIADPGNGTNSATYGYDVLDRLTSALANGVTRGYGYDAIGNRTASNVDAASTTYTYPGTSHRLQSLTGATTRSYAYDAAGNPTQIDAAVHGYNLANRLTSVNSTSSASYKVNALGQRVAKTVDGVTTRYVYDEQGRLIGEYQADGTLIQETVWLDDLPVATLRPTGSGTPTPVAIYYVHADHLGSPRAITRPTDDQIVWRWDNAEPFGANAANENPSGLGNFRYDLRFPGQQYDPETATHYNYFRDYDPSVGRYKESDPIGLRGGLNTYSYGLANPINYADPMGLDAYLCSVPGQPHFYTCVERRCAGLYPKTKWLMFGGPGEVRQDPFREDRCQKVPVPTGCDAAKFEKCVEEKNRPGATHWYSLPVYNCASWASDVIFSCMQAACTVK